MTDIELVWFTCKNPNCADFHKSKDRKFTGESPITFMKYVYGSKQRIYDNGELIEISISCEYGTIILYSMGEKRAMNSYIHSVKGAIYCSLCFDRLTKTRGLDSFISNQEERFI